MSQIDNPFQSANPLRMEAEKRVAISETVAAENIGDLSLDE